jgi:UDP-glucose:(heptosyl)LPS alpha-1,3-glucosyltransferase
VRLAARALVCAPRRAQERAHFAADRAPGGPRGGGGGETVKVAILQQHVDVRRGGAETSTLEFAGHLAQFGLDVTVVCQAPDADGGPVAGPVGPANLRLQALPGRARTRVGRTLAYLRGVQALCRTEAFDLVHAVTPSLAADVYQPRGGTYPETVSRTLARVRWPAWRAMKRLGRRFNVSQRLLQRIERRLLRRPRVTVAALSDYVRRQVLAEGVAPERIRLVFNGVDIAPLSAGQRCELRRVQRREFELPEAARVVLFAAHNFALKGLRELLCAAPGADWLLVVAGRDHWSRYARLAARLGVAGRVRVAGPGELRAWYAAADVLAHPTWYDPCSRVVLEALSVGLPVVTTRWNGAAEVMEPGRHGYVVNRPEDAAALAGAIAQALDPRVAAACRADADRLHARLAMRRHAEELAALYRDLRP